MASAPPKADSALAASEAATEVKATSEAVRPSCDCAIQRYEDHIQQLSKNETLAGHLNDGRHTNLFFQLLCSGGYWLGLGHRT